MKYLRNTLGIRIFVKDLHKANHAKNEQIVNQVNDTSNWKSR